MTAPVASYTALFLTMFVKAVGYSYKYLHILRGGESWGQRKQLPLHIAKRGAPASLFLPCLTGYYKLILSNDSYFIIACLLTSANVITKFG